MNDRAPRFVRRWAVCGLVLTVLAACSGSPGTTTGTAGATGSATGGATSAGSSTGSTTSSSAAGSSSAAASSTGTGAGTTGTSSGTGGSSTGGIEGTTTGGGPTTYVYIETNDPSSDNTNAVLAYERHNQTLVPLPGVSGFALGGQGVADSNFTLGPIDADQQVVIDQANKRLYAINEGSSTIGAFDINDDGSLSAIAGSPYDSGGDNPVSLAVSGKLLYVVNQAYDNLSAPNYTALAINDDGSLSAIPGLKPMTTDVGASPSQILLSPSNQVAFGADFLGPMASPPIQPIRSFQLNGDGSMYRAPGDPYEVPAAAAPNNMPTGNSLALGLAVHPTQKILYVGFVLFNAVGAYTYDSTGALTYYTNAPLTGALACWLVVNSEANRLYVSNTGDASISVVDITKPLQPVEIQHYLL